MRTSNGGPGLRRLVMNFRIQSPATPVTLGSNEYATTSPQWQKWCSYLPSSEIIAWPGYATASKRVWADGQWLTIQCWKGWCQQMLRGVALPGRLVFPGGVGAEVGVYRDAPPPSPFFPWAPPEYATRDGGIPRLRIGPLFDLVGDAWVWWQEVKEFVQAPKDRKLWWAATKAVAGSKRPVRFSLSVPGIPEPFIDDYENGTYWTCLWMDRDRHTDWLRSQGAPEADISDLNAKLDDPNQHVDPSQYLLTFSVAGVDYEWSSGTIQGMEPIRNKTGAVVAWLDGDSIRSLDGDYLAFIHKEHVVAYASGTVVGSFQRGVICDAESQAIGTLANTDLVPTVEQPRPQQPSTRKEPNRPEMRASASPPYSAEWSRRGWAPWQTGLLTPR